MCLVLPTKFLSSRVFTSNKDIQIVRLSYEDITLGESVEMRKCTGRPGSPGKLRNTDGTSYSLCR